jgi:hypothetical protein
MSFSDSMVAIEGMRPGAQAISGLRYDAAL